MRTAIIAAAIALASFGIANTSSAQDLDISTVTSIEVNVACQLIIVQGKNPSIEISGSKRALAEIETTIRKGTLDIRSDREKQQREDIKVKIEVNNLEHLDIGGSVYVRTPKTLEFENFSMSISGVASGKMNLASKHFDLDCSGVCNMSFEGECDILKLDVSGVGNINTTALATRIADVDNSGVSRIIITAKEYLNASVSGVGAIRYTGNPLVRKSVSGLGIIREY